MDKTWKRKIMDEVEKKATLCDYRGAFLIIDVCVSIVTSAMVLNYFGLIPAAVTMLASTIIFHTLAKRLGFDYY